MTAKTWMGTNDPYIRLRKIEALNLEANYEEITRLFFDDFKSVAILNAFSGFMMNNAAPRISRILAATGELEHRVAKRFVDTALLASTVSSYGLKKRGPGQDAARRVSAMHSRYDIHPDDFIMVACDQLVMALRYAEKFGWRSVTDKERQALRLFYTYETRAFGGKKTLPPTLEEAYTFWDHYLNEQAVLEPQNVRLADAMINFIKGLFPRIMRPFIAPILLSQIDDRIVRACGKRIPGPVCRAISSLFLKHILGKQDPLPDFAPDGFKKLIQTVYPNGYTIDGVGTHI